MLKAKVSTCGKGTISINLCRYPNSLLYARHFITGSKNSSVYGLTVEKIRKCTSEKVNIIMNESNMFFTWSSRHFKRSKN